VTDPSGETHLQPVLKEPRFSVNAFFYFLFALMLISWISYHLLTRLKIARSESCDLKSVVDESDVSDSGSLVNVFMPNQSQMILLVIQAYGCFLMNGFLSALSTYSTLPYGNTAYHLATTLTVISGPTATLLVFLLHQKGSFERPIFPLLLLGSAAAAYLIFLATMSPTPPLQDSVTGCAIAVITAITCHGCFSYIKACIAGSLRECSLGGRTGLFYYGVATQAGSLMGALVVFCLMRFANIFHAFHPCS
jgi:riboflavin transporter 2